jgi:hypothetical protein
MRTRHESRPAPPPPAAGKPFAVVITKLDGKRRVEFNRYATLAQARIDAAGLRRHGIDARAVDPGELALEHPEPPGKVLTCPSRS